jgi:UDP-N-acetylglucosamine 2-epimerase (non-hydrolysing)
MGAQLHAICNALERIVAEEAVHVVFPVHLNPNVRDVVHARLAGNPRIHLVEPLPYPDLLEVMRRAYLVLSDSGGIQEEVPSFRKPILILRDCTERPEVVQAGFGELVGTDADRIVERTAALLHDPTWYASRIAGTNPFGDGHAAVRIADIVDRTLRVPSAERGPRRL